MDISNVRVRWSIRTVLTTIFLGHTDKFPFLVIQTLARL